ncbi:MAG: DNA primase [Bacillota bacterium]
MVDLGGHIPGEFIEAVLNQTDIVNLIGDHVRLTRKGQRYTGLCPFHQERTPSFTVSPEKQFFYCFGCGAGGDALKFLMMRENLTFPEALERLAERAGIKLPETGLDPAAERRQREREEAWRVNKLAAGYYEQQLVEKTGEQARRYLEKRGITKEVAAKFGLGYAPSSHDALLRYLRDRKVSGEEALRYGLALRHRTGELLDRFRGRLIFPISDGRGRVVGFGGRVLEDAVLPKYLNSAETPFFNKRELLYALYQARDAIRQSGSAVIVEGYLDAITAHQFGFCNVVASLGTSLTREQARLLLRYTGSVVIAYDNDAAGTAATLRGLDILQESGFRVRVVIIPQGKDPDDFLRAGGRDAWENAVGQAMPLIDFKGMHLAGKGLNTAAAKMAVLKEMLPNIGLLPTTVEREEGIRTAAQLTGLNWDVVRSELDRFLEKGQKSWLNKSKSAKNKHNAENIADARQRAEAGIIRVLIERPDLLPRLEAVGGGRFFSGEQHRRVYVRIQEITDREDLRLPLLFSRLGEEDKEMVAGILSEGLVGEPEALLDDYMILIRKKQRRERRQELLLELKAAEKTEDSERTRQLLKDLQTLTKNGKEG